MKVRVHVCGCELDRLAVSYAWMELHYRTSSPWDWKCCTEKKYKISLIVSEQRSEKNLKKFHLFLYLHIIKLQALINLANLRLQVYVLQKQVAKLSKFKK